MYAPRAKFERIYIVSPIKVAIIFLTLLHCLFILIASLTSFWVRTSYGHYGPLYSCEKRLDWTKPSTYPISIKCGLGQFFNDKNLYWMPITAALAILSFLLAFISIIVATLSFVKNSFTIRRRYWLCTIILLLFVFLIDSFLILFIPLNHRRQVYHLQWAYGVHCGATLFILVSSIAAILTHNTDDIQYVEAIDESSIDK
ncbi:unnamed protein product [Rotaria magnacalcarata]|uniref:Uncharacterized protein n=1 Tax=Rotaria magnacalcarata TaxID=392030 RepID=A0A814DW59_9BILA|nr:unnamed protein product [Rotaria magnacalcarata]CAF1535520.1 unnamed protein product [Rotaria magnacalcarata]CAF2134460.1 unnamed protein product [Rotaria magnacalcarata]CAF3834387.1 unnamed protein product [Rotaria magnacalcarata]CAF4147323.1 unnamed protein product [Rotaria magnacalcarata]